MATGGARAHTNIDRDVAPLRELRGSSDTGLFADLAPMLFLVDGGNLLWRAAHAPRAPFPADDGRDLTPLFRFMTMLRRTLGTYGLFAECVVCFDGAEAWTSRVEVDATYKGNRSYEDADLSFMGWLPEIRAALDACGVANIELSDHEADDVIATLEASVGDRCVRILSTDRDYYQLISATTTVVNPKVRGEVVDPAVVFDRHGVTAAQWLDFRTLCGDPSDGIPGLPGVGMTNAAAMLADGATLESLREMDERVRNRWDDIVRWRELIRLRTDVDTGYTATGRSTPTLPSAIAVCEELGLVKPRPVRARSRRRR